MTTPERIYSYQHPMHSAGVGVIFYYQVDDKVYLLLQKRSMNMSTAPGKLGIAGGYLDAEIKHENEPEDIIDGLWREVEEELGEAFVNNLPKTAFSPMNVAYIRHNKELNRLNNNEYQSNLHYIWTLHITKEVADLAYPCDESELESVEHVLLEDLENCNPCIWLPGVVEELVKGGKIVKLPHIDDYRINQC